MPYPKSGMGRGYARARHARGRPLIPHGYASGTVGESVVCVCAEAVQRHCAGDPLTTFPDRGNDGSHLRGPATLPSDEDSRKPNRGRSMNRQPQWSPARQNLRSMVRENRDRLLVGIGVSNGYEARQLHHTIHELYAQGAVPDFIGGFITFVSGYLCAATYGLPDMGYILRAEIAQQTNIIEQATWLAALDTGRPAFPIGVDIDTGYGNEPASVILTCRQVHKQGAQYAQIEDQYAINKTCGHMDGSRGAGKRVVSAEEMIEQRIKPAVAYARSQDDFIVMARTDAISPYGFEEGIRRAHQYAEAGAEMLFIEALLDDDQLKTAAREFSSSDAVIVANMIEGSPKTPYKSPYELHQLGFNMALYCIGTLLAGREAQQRYFSTIGQGKSVMSGVEGRPEHWFDGFNTVIGREQTERINQFFVAPH
jgi:2-methylisocitrate lyase-like PEP mutase family enzyme